MKHQRTIFLFSIISLTLFVTSTGAYPSGLTQRTSAQELRHKGNQMNAPRLNKLRHGRAPIPGGIGSGVTYSPGQLRIISATNLDTEMIVYPAGLKLPNNWLFTTATNRSEQGVEVVGIYYGNKKGALGVFDWSCAASSPCVNSDGSLDTGPSWVWTDTLAPTFNCNYHLSDVNGNQLQVLHYSNRTFQVTGGWRNEVYLQNYCTNSWDLVYSHSFNATQKDCSLDNSCGWWGPIIETFFSNSQPSLKQVGFLNSTITIDDTSQLLTPVNTNWTPPPFEWSTFFLQFSHSWGVGTRMKTR